MSSAQYMIKIPVKSIEVRMRSLTLPECEEYRSAHAFFTISCEEDYRNALIKFPAKSIEVHTFNVVLGTLISDNTVYSMHPGSAH